jgi:hypothetical protein
MITLVSNVFKIVKAILKAPILEIDQLCATLASVDILIAR